MGLRKLSFSLALLAALVLTLLPAGIATAAQDVRVVVDISGSMKLNDPDNLRRPAVRLLARLLPDGTGVGLWTFGREVNMLVPHGRLNDNQRQALIDGSAGINSVAQWTNIGGAIATASDPWYSPQQSLINTHLILLSDGKVDIDTRPEQNNAEREHILGELVPGLAAQGLTIHTIALSADADLDLLGAIADLTGGAAHVAGSADELSRIFADTLGQAVPANELPLADNRFTVDDGVEEFTALIFSDTPAASGQLTLNQPDGTQSTLGQAGADVRWVREPGYDLITVTRPEAGEWHLDGLLGDGSRVTVVSDLQLEVRSLPPRFQAGDGPELEVFFSEAGEPITDEEFLGVITVRLTLTAEDGRQGARVLSEGHSPTDGVYRDSFGGLTVPGQYQLELTADGRTFSRKFRQTLTVLAPDDADLTAADSVAPQPAPDVDPDPSAELASPIDVGLAEEPALLPDTSDLAETGPSTSSRDPLWLWLGAGTGLILLVVLAMILRRRRAQAVSEKPERQPDGADEADDAPVSAPPDAEAVTGDGAQKGLQDSPLGDQEMSLPQEDSDEEFQLEDFDLSDLDSLPQADAGKGTQFAGKEDASAKKPPGKQDSRDD